MVRLCWSCYCCLLTISSSRIEAPLTTKRSNTSIAWKEAVSQRSYQVGRIGCSSFLKQPCWRNTLRPMCRTAILESWILHFQIWYHRWQKARQKVQNSIKRRKTWVYLAMSGCQIGKIGFDQWIGKLRFKCHFHYFSQFGTFSCFWAGSDRYTELYGKILVSYTLLRPLTFAPEIRDGWQFVWSWDLIVTFLCFK